MIHTDFVLELAPGHIVVLGWIDQRQSDKPTLEVDGTVFRDTRHEFFARADLGDAAATGFLLHFEPTAPYDKLRVLTDADRHAVDLSHPREDWSRFARHAVDEIFFHLLYEIVSNPAVKLPPDILTLLEGRLASIELHEFSDRFAALSVDDAVCCRALEMAVSSGWFIKSGWNASSVLPFYVSNGTIGYPEFLENARPHWGLDDFRDRYELTGEDGYLSIIGRNAPDSLPEHAFYFIKTPGACRLLRRGFRFVSRVEMIRFLSADLKVLEPHGNTLLAHMKSAPTALSLPVSLTPLDARPDHAVVLLNHDAEDADIREVLRLLLLQTSARITVQPLQPAATIAFREAVNGALIEAEDGRLTVLPPTAMPDYTTLCRCAPVMLYASSSALVQFEDWPAAFEPLAQGQVTLAALVDDPILRLEDADQQQMLDSMVRRLAPVMIAAVTAGLAPLLNAVKQDFETVGAHFRAAAWEIAKADHPFSIQLQSRRNVFTGQTVSETTERASSEALAEIHDRLLLSRLEPREVMP